MTFEPQLRTDILDTELSTEPKRIKVAIESQFKRIVDNAETWDRTTTPGPSKNIIEVMDLIGQAINDYDQRTHKTTDAQVFFTYESPNTDKQLEAISISLIEREPGMYGQGSPSNKSKIKNLRPILREVKDDPDNPGYKRAILGYFYDNILQLTCWARTNKAANARALWLENVMEEYTWYFVLSGVNRIFYHGRGMEISKDISGNRIYGRPIKYYVRTEKIRAVSQKTLETIYVNLAKATYTSL